MDFLSYSANEKKLYYSKKADVIANKYNKQFKNHRVMSYSDLLVTKDSKAYEHCKRLIKSKEYDSDMYKLMYYTSRSLGNNHNSAKEIASNSINEIKYKNVVQIKDVNNILKNHVRLEE